MDSSPEFTRVSKLSGMCLVMENLDQLCTPSCLDVERRIMTFPGAPGLRPLLRHGHWRRSETAKNRRPAAGGASMGSSGPLQRDSLIPPLDSVIIIAVGVRRSLKHWIGRVLGKSGPRVVAVFLSGDAALSRSMALRMRELAPDYPHVIIGAGEIDRSHFKYAQDIIVVNPHRLLASWLELRRRLGRRWIALAPFLWQRGEQSEADSYRLLRWLPWLLAPRKLLAFNARLERHHVRLRLPIASWRFLRGEP